MCRGQCDVMSESDDSDGDVSSDERDDYDEFPENERVILKFMDHLRRGINFSSLDIDFESTAEKYQGGYNEMRSAQIVREDNYIHYFKDFFFMKHEWDHIEYSAYFLLFFEFDKNYEP
jgi:hypothetical protein